MGSFRLELVLVLGVAACVGDSPPAPASDASVADTGTDVVAEAASDSPTDASSSPCALEKPFEPAIPFDAVNTNLDEVGLRFSADGSRAYFARPTNTFGYEIFVATKAGAYADGVALAGVNSAKNEYDPSLSSDQLEIFFMSADPIDDAGTAVQHTWRASRAQTSMDFNARAPVGALVGSITGTPFLSADGTTLYFTDFVDIKSTTRISGAQFAPPNVELQGGLSPVLSPDTLTMYFKKSNDIWVTRRSSTSSIWPAGTPVTELNTAGTDSPTDLSADGCTIYFSSDRPTSKAAFNVWSAKKPAN